MSPSKKIVICGAGIAGVSAAHFLAASNAGDITLVDERPPLTLTSDRSTECYRKWWPDEAMLSLMNRSIDLMDQLAASSSNVFRMNRRGYLYLTAEGGEGSALHRQAAATSALGGGPLRLHSKPSADYSPLSPDGLAETPDGADLLLGSDLIRHYFPGTSSRASAALHVRRAGWLSAQQMGMHLLERARQEGANLIVSRVMDIATIGGRISGVALEDGRQLDCDAVVLAAGPYLKPVASLLGLDLPIEAEIHLKVAFEDHLHVIPRDAPLLIWTDAQSLPWNTEERRLFESEPELRWLAEPFPGGAHTRPEGGPDSSTVLMLWDYRTETREPIFPVPLDEQYPEIVLRGLAAMLPGLQAYFGRAPRPQLDGGYYVKTPENRPLIGPTEVEGAYLIGALSGYGIMSACAAGELLAAHVIGSSLPPYASAFSPERYDDPAYLRTLEAGVGTGEL